MDDDKIDYDNITIGSSDTIDTIDLNNIMSASVTIPSLWNTPSGNVTISSTSSSYSTYSIGATGASGNYLYTTSGANGTSWGTPNSGIKAPGGLNDPDHGAGLDRPKRSGDDENEGIHQEGEGEHHHKPRT